jgi:uncharacterized protein
MSSKEQRKNEVIVLITFLFISIATHSASFDCSLAKTHVETSICDSKYLSGLDIWLNNAYQRHFKYKSASEKKIFRKSQLMWLKYRDAECHGEHTIDCLSDLYRKRIAQIDKENTYLADDMEENAPELLAILRQSNQFAIRKVPNYLKLNQDQYLVAIDWGQGGRIQLGLYLVIQSTRNIKKLRGGIPSFDGIYQDSDRTIIVIRTHTQSRGLGSQTIDAIEIRDAEIKQHHLVGVSYYAGDGEPQDVCSQAKLHDVPIDVVGDIKKLSIHDLDGDQYRDIVVNVKYTNCLSGEVSNKEVKFLSADR